MEFAVLLGGICVGGCGAMKRQEWEGLLGLFGADRESAGREYEALRGRLSDFFRYAQVRDPEAAADEVFDRVAKKVDEGVAIESVVSYVLAVARFVRQEKWNQGRRETAALVEWSRDRETTPEEEGREQDCLERCLGHWAAGDREFLLAYYQGDGAARIAQRQRLAAREGIRLNALRNRALRLRARLEECLQKCMGEDPGDSSAISGTEKRKR